ncbi:MAG: urease accessory protein UreE [Myxococcota bacterium]
MMELIELREDAGETSDCLTLPYDLRQKSRQRVQLDSGREAAVLLPHGSRLRQGDRLRSSEGDFVQVHAAAEALSTVRTDDLVLLARACYHLGNRHVPLQVGNGWLRYQPDHVLDDMIRGLGLEVTPAQVSFEPERGAYHDHGSSPSQKHQHAHAATTGGQP